MDKNQLRNSIMNEEELMASRRRFGLFSQPPPLAVGDDGHYKQKKHQRGSDSKPVTQPRQLLAGPRKTGHSKSSYFTTPSSILQEDPYSNSYKREIAYQNKMHTRSTMHQKEFKPSSGPQSLLSAAYQYQEQKELRREFPKKDQAGRILTKSRNIATNPTTTIDRILMPFPKHVPDPYDRKRQFDIQERQLWKSKMPQQIYKTMNHSHGTFSNNQTAYGSDGKAKQVLKNSIQLLKKRSQSLRKLVTKAVEHEQPFKPARKGHGDPIGKYPQFMNKKSEGSTTLQKKGKTTFNVDQLNWKPTNPPLSRPCPSISLNKLNLMRRR